MRLLSVTFAPPKVSVDFFLTKHNLPDLNIINLLKVKVNKILKL